MPNAPLCPWCGHTLPRMMLGQYDIGLDDLACPTCARPVPRRLVFPS